MIPNWKKLEPAIVMSVVTVLIIVSFTAVVTNAKKGQFADNSIVITVTKETPTHATSTTPADPDGPASTWSYSDIVYVKEDTVIDRIEASMKGAPIETMHHLSVFIVGEPDEVCSDGTHNLTDEIYTVSRNNVYPVEFQEPYGIHLPAGTALRMEFMEHTRAEPYGPGGNYDEHELVVALHKADDPEKRPVPLKFIRTRLDDTPCAPPSAHQAFKVEVGDGLFVRQSESDEDGRYVFTEDGTILNRSANVWPAKGGKSVTAYLNGEAIDHFEPVALDKPWQFSIPSHTDPILVKAGDTLTISSAYQNPFRTPVKDASGMFGFYFAPNN